MTVVTIEKVTSLEPITQPDLFTLPLDQIDRILAEEQTWPKLPPDPCLLVDSSEEYEEVPVSEYQDSMEAAGYPYW